MIILNAYVIPLLETKFDAKVFYNPMKDWP